MILSGIRILDLSRVLAVPFTTQLLSDFGAEIWKIEALQGDDARVWGDSYFNSVNRGKKSIAIDMKQERGRSIVQALARKADMLVENFKVEDLKRYRLDYASVIETNPTIIYLSLTGFGQTGPRRAQLGYDTVIQGMTGIMSLTGDADRMPNKVGVPWIDVMAGMTSAIGLLLALLERRESGRGQYIDVSLFDVGIWALIESAQKYLETGEAPTRQGAVHRNFAPSQPFKCSDGWIMLAIGKDAQFERFCAAIGMAELAKDPRYSTNDARMTNRTSLIDTISSLLSQRTRDELLEACSSAQVPVSPINDIAEVLEDRQSEARQAVWAVPAPDGTRRYLGNALQHMSLTRPAPQGPAPRLGQHTVDILRRELAMQDDDVRTLVADRVVVDGSA